MSWCITYQLFLLIVLGDFRSILQWVTDLPVRFYVSLATFKSNSGPFCCFYKAKLRPHFGEIPCFRCPYLLLSFFISCSFHLIFHLLFLCLPPVYLLLAVHNIVIFCLFLCLSTCANTSIFWIFDALRLCAKMALRWRFVIVTTSL